MGLAAAVAVLLVVLGHHHQAQANSLATLDDQGRPLIRTIVDGSEYIAPVFEDIQMSERRQQFDREMIANLMGLLRKLVQAVVVEKRNTIMVGKITLGIVPIARKTSSSLRELQKTDTSPPLADGFGKKMSNLIFTILAKKTDVKLTDEQAARRAFNLLQAVQNLCDQSPTGLYLDWRTMRVDGELLEDHATPLVNWAKRNGYGLVLKGFNGLAMFVKSFSGGNSKQNAEE